MFNLIRIWHLALWHFWHFGMARQYAVKALCGMSLAAIEAQNVAMLPGRDDAHSDYAVITKSPCSSDDKPYVYGIHSIGFLMANHRFPDEKSLIRCWA